MSVIDEYIKDTATPTQKVELERIRSIVHKLVPDAVETIGYGIPTFKYNGKNLLHFAAFKNHMSLFPTASPIAELKDQLKPWATAKGTIQFTEANPLPEKLIKEIVEYRLLSIPAPKK